MHLAQAFGLVRGDVVAFIGAGGKTATVLALGHALAERGWRVLAANTTGTPAEQLAFFPAALPTHASQDAIAAALDAHRLVLLYGSARPDGGVSGVGASAVGCLLDRATSDVLLVEADGAAGLPLKAPYAHEPLLPQEATLVVLVASLAVLGQPLDEQHVYNAAAIDARYGFGLGNTVVSPWVAQVLRDPELGLAGVPAEARVVALLNRTPAEGYERDRARQIAQMMLSSTRLSAVVLGAARAADPVVEVQRPVGAVVLAGGMSTRMGQHKQLLAWDEGRTIIEQVVYQLQRARLANVVVVTGHQRAALERVLLPYEVTTVFNPAYAVGEMLSSLQVGLRAMPAHVAAALVVLGDQPQLQVRTLQQVTLAYAEGQGTLVAPSYQMRRGHPILIDRRYWRDILALDPQHASLRDVLRTHEEAIVYVTVDNDSVLQDVDTPQDYNDARRRAGLP